MTSGKKNSSQDVSQKKHVRRRLITFSRVLRYGLDNFVRNSWLSVAATAVMIVTLLIIFAVGAMRIIMVDTIGSLRDKVDMSIYLKNDTSDETASLIKSDLEKLASVRSVTYCNSACARDEVAKENADDPEMLEAITEATNELPAVLRVVVENIDDTEELQYFVSTNTRLKSCISNDYEPSFAGDRRDTIQSIGRVVGFVQTLGVLAGVVFVVISALIIFNTIRMAIYNRKDEIQMEKLIGASRWFIRGPFLVEAAIYGVIAAIVATFLGLWILNSTSATLNSYGIVVQPTINFLMSYMAIVLVVMIGCGTLIGIISSLLATRRYLKI